MSGIIAGGALLGASAIGKGITGLSQEHQASQIEKNNIRPVQTVDPAYQQNVNTAQQMAQIGLPQQQYNNQLNAINQNQAGAISALGNSANPGAGLASIVRAGNNATGNLNAEDAAARNRNTLNLIQQRGILAGANKDAWNYNYADKYSENLAKSQALRGAGMQNVSGAFNDLGQAGMSVLGNLPGKVPGGTPDGSYIDPSGLSSAGVPSNNGFVNNTIPAYQIPGQ